MMFTRRLDWLHLLTLLGLSLMVGPMLAQTAGPSWGVYRVIATSTVNNQKLYWDFDSLAEAEEWAQGLSEEGWQWTGDPKDFYWKDIEIWKNNKKIGPKKLPAREAAKKLVIHYEDNLTKTYDRASQFWEKLRNGKKRRTLNHIRMANTLTDRYNRVREAARVSDYKYQPHQFPDYKKGKLPKKTGEDFLAEEEAEVNRLENEIKNVREAKRVIMDEIAELRKRGDPFDQAKDRAKELAKKGAEEDRLTREYNRLKEKLKKDREEWDKEKRKAGLGVSGGITARTPLPKKGGTLTSGPVLAALNRERAGIESAKRTLALEKVHLAAAGQRLGQGRAALDTAGRALAARKATLAEQARTLSQQSATLNATSGQLGREKTQLDATLAQLNQKLSRLDARAARLRQEKAKLEAARPQARSKSKVRRFNRRVRKYNARLTAYERRQASYNAEVAAYNQATDSYNTRMAAFRLEAQGHYARLTAHGQEAQRLEAELAQHQRQGQIQQSQEAEHRRQVQAHEAKARQHQQRVQAFKAQLAGHR